MQVRSDYEKEVIGKLMGRDGPRTYAFASIEAAPVSFRFNGTEQMKVEPGGHVMIGKVVEATEEQGPNRPTYFVICPVSLPLSGYGIDHWAYVDINDPRIVDVRYTPMPTAEAYRYVMDRVTHANL